MGEKQVWPPPSPRYPNSFNGSKVGIPVCGISSGPTSVVVRKSPARVVASFFHNIVPDSLEKFLSMADQEARTISTVP